MSSQILATCATCGQQTFDPAQVMLIAHGDALPHACLFSCPVCREQIRRDLSPPLAHQILTAGCPITRLQPEIPAQREPLTLDDLIDLGHDLEAL